MSNKAKGKEALAVIDESSSDSDAEFFTARERRPIKPMKTPIRTRPSPSPPPISSDDDDDGSDDIDKRRRKRARIPKKVNPSLPDWARGGSIGADRKSVNRGSTEERRTRDGSRAEPIAIDSSPNGESGVHRIRKLSLTPPPPLPEAQKEKINRMLSQHLAQPIENPLTAPDPGTSSDGLLSSSPVASRNGSSETIQITVRMVADPMKKVSGSENAIKHYEKQRVFQLALSQPLTIMINALAAAIQKPPESLVFVYDSQRIFATRSTISELGITAFAEITGYEKHVFDQMEKEKRQARQKRLAELAGEPTPPPSDGPDTPTYSKTKSQAKSDDNQSSPMVPPPPELKKIRLKLRGPDGTVKNVDIIHTTSAGSLVKWYCGKMQAAGGEQKNMKLIIDGEAVDDDSTVEELELEHGDLVDIR